MKIRPVISLSLGDEIDYFPFHNPIRQVEFYLNQNNPFLFLPTFLNPLSSGFPYPLLRE